MELQSWLLYHLVAVSDCNQVMQSAATGGGAYPAAVNNNNNNNNNGNNSNNNNPTAMTATAATASAANGNNNNNNNNNNNINNNSRAKDFGLRAQKKLLGRFAASTAGRSLLIDDATTSLLDNLYRLMERAARSSQQLDKRQPEKVLKNIVKLSIKIGLLHRNQQLGPSDAASMEEVRRSLRATAMAVLSFYELEFSYERAYLVKSLERCRASVQALIKPHLTDKSQDRCDQVFDFLVHPDFLEAVFAANSELRPVLGALVADVNKALETGQL